jgi:hypothetical protein
VAAAAPAVAFGAVTAAYLVLQLAGAQ